MVDNYGGTVFLVEITNILVLKNYLRIVYK